MVQWGICWLPLVAAILLMNVAQVELSVVTKVLYYNVICHLPFVAEVTLVRLVLVPPLAGSVARHSLLSLFGHPIHSIGYL